MGGTTVVSQCHEKRSTTSTVLALSPVRTLKLTDSFGKKSILNKCSIFNLDNTSLVYTSPKNYTHFYVYNLLAFCNFKKM